MARFIMWRDFTYITKFPCHQISDQSHEGFPKMHGLNISDNTHAPYHSKPNLTIPNQTKCPLPIHNFVDFPVVFQAWSSKFFIQLHLGNTQYTIQFKSRPNQT